MFDIIKEKRVEVRMKHYKHGIYDGTFRSPYEKFVNIDDLSITTLQVHDGTKFIQDDACKDAFLLKNVTFPYGLQSIGERAFYGCESMDTIHIPSSVYSLGAYSFSGELNRHMNLTSVGFDDRGHSQLTYIDKYAFNNCNRLAEIELPNSLKNIGTAAFCNTGLYKVSLPNSVETIGNLAFCDCQQLNSVTIGDNVRKIGDSAFFNCSNLQEIEIPANVRHIGHYTFGSCNNLRTVSIDNNTMVEPTSFFQCSSLVHLKLSGNHIDAHELIQNIPSLREVTIAHGARTIEANAFCDCRQLETINIPQSMRIIESGAFAGCYSLKSIELPSTIEYVDPSAFTGCYNLRTVMIGDTKISIDNIQDLNNFQSMLVDAQKKSVTNDTSINESKNIHTLTDLVDDGKAFVVNNNLVYVNPEVCGRLIIDTSIEHVSSGALRDGNISIVEAEEHLRREVTQEGKRFEALEVMEHSMEPNNDYEMEM